VAFPANGSAGKFRLRASIVALGGNREHRRDAYDTMGSATCVTLRPSEKYHRRPACVRGMTAIVRGPNQRKREDLVLAGLLVYPRTRSPIVLDLVLVLGTVSGNVQTPGQGGMTYLLEQDGLLQ